MKAKYLAEELLKHPDFDVKFHDYYQDFPSGELCCNRWSNVEIMDIGYNDKAIILTGEID